MTLSSSSGTRRENARSDAKAATAGGYQPGTYYILEYHKGKGEKKKATFTRTTTRAEQRAKLEKQGYTIDREYTHRT